MLKKQDWTIQEILSWTQNYFKEKNILSSRLDAEVLLAHTLGKDRVYLYTHFDKPLTKEERDVFRLYVKRRSKYEPIAYILGKREFFSLNFEVNKNVLIPRPETEHLIERAITWTQENNLDNPHIVDIGTGCGNIAITLASKIPKARIIACDISEKALEIAKKNALKHHVEEKIEFFCSDLLDSLKTEPKYDIIVSNPPYIQISDKKNLDPDIHLYEPHQALFAGEDGLFIIEKLFKNVSAYLSSPGIFICEHGYNQSDTLHKFFDQFFDNKKYICTDILDLSGKNRAVMIQKI